MIVIGLTGSIGMGKSTTMKMFAEAGIPVWDADTTVHRLYGPDGPGTAAVEEIAPEAVTVSGVDRTKLREAILRESSLLKKIEQAIHPLVGADRSAFLAAARAAGCKLVLCDIPLLFETGGEKSVDKIVVVTAEPDVQRARVLKRPGMTEEAFEAILAKQVPDSEKRDRADFVIDTGKGMEHARARVAEIIAELTGEADA